MLVIFMIILGIDPGLANLGIGVIEVNKKTKKAKHLNNYYLTTSPKLCVGERLSIIYNQVKIIINNYNPGAIIIERAFFGARGFNIADVIEVIGALKLLAFEKRVGVSSITPKMVKKMVAGSAKATKNQVMEAVCKKLSMSKPPKTSHESDALAIALSHLELN